MTAAFFAEGFGLVFHFIGTVVNDSEWQLPAEDAEELGERTQRWLATLDAKNLAAVQKLLGRIQPASSLFMSLAAVIAPRVKHTREKKRNAINTPEKAKAGGGTQASAPISEASSGMASQGANGKPAEQRGPERWDGVSFGRHSWEQAANTDVQ